MKKIKSILLTTLSLAFIMVTSGCLPETEQHIHTFTDNWSSDSVFHWHAATCEHTDEIIDNANHSFGKYISNNDGSKTKTRTCTICNYKDTIPELKGFFEGISTQTQGQVVGNLTLHEKEINKTSMVIVIPDGMAVTIDDTENRNSGDVFSAYRKVKLTSYTIGQYEVTRELFDEVMGYIPSKASKVIDNKENGPVSGVHFFESIIFCNKLSLLCNLEPVYSYTLNGQKVTNPDIWISRMGYIKDRSSNDSKFSTWAEGLEIDISKNGYRLPTEAEWEFAARGGDPNEEDWNYTYSGSNTLTEVACIGSFNVTTVGSKAANRLGIYDMSGNVSEMCNDTCTRFSNSKLCTNPLVLSSNKTDNECKIVRGGTGMMNEKSLNTKTSCYQYVKDTIDSLAGFRLARTLNTNISE